MGIASLSGATLDCAISYLKNADTPVIFHLGTNNCQTDSTEDMIQKFDTLHQQARFKYPNANIAFCKIPTQFGKAENTGDINTQVNDVNNLLRALDGVSLIEINVEASMFVRDGKHYNKRGLAVLAGAIKAWARENEHVSSSLTSDIHRQNSKGNPLKHRRREKKLTKNNGGGNFQMSMDPNQYLINLLLANISRNFR